MAMSVLKGQTGPSPADVWASGDYADVCDRMIPLLGARLTEIAGVQAGDDVLDVAAGTGNAALPAAATGAKVTAVDITVELLRAGSERARNAGLDIRWVHGDAHALPLRDSSFDRVISCVGVQFCADPPTTAAELLRVCRPGGWVALIAWTREGFIGQVLSAVAKATSVVSSIWSPLDWGSEEKVSLLMAQQVEPIAFGREHALMAAESAAGWVDYMADAYGPLVRARTALASRGEWDALRLRLIQIASAHGQGTGGKFSARAEYLTAVMRRHAQPNPRTDPKVRG